MVENKNPNAVDIETVMEETGVSRRKAIRIYNSLKHISEVNAGYAHYQTLGERKTPETSGKFRGGKVISL